MKRFILAVLLILFSFTPVFSEQTVQNETDANSVKETYKLKGQVEYDDNPIETIYLDEDIEKPQINIPKKTLKVPVSVLNITSNANTPRSALARAMTNRGSLSDIMPLSGSVTDSIGGFSYGQTWGQEISYAQMEDNTSFFIRYDWPKYFSLTTSIRQAVSQEVGTQFNTLRIIPELHITKRLTLKDTFSSYMNLPKNKNEITIVYTPELKQYVDALKFELGLAQSFYNDGSQSYALSFTTGFKL